MWIRIIQWGTNGKEYFWNSAGDHCDHRMSRHVLPLLLLFGKYILVNATLGGLRGKSVGKWIARKILHPDWDCHFASYCSLPVRHAISNRTGCTLCWAGVCPVPGHSIPCEFSLELWWEASGAPSNPWGQDEDREGVGEGAWGRLMITHQWEKMGSWDERVWGDRMSTGAACLVATVSLWMVPLCTAAA